MLTLLPAKTNMLHILLQVKLNLVAFKGGISAFVTAFIVAMIIMPFLIKLINRFKLFDVPDLRKEHNTPIPTMGGIASCMGMAVSCLLWFRFQDNPFIISFFFSICILFVIGMMDDLRNISARYKLVIQIAVSSLIAFSGVRLVNLDGLFGIHEIPLLAQYSLTILAITGITNAFNLIDGIDGLAGGLGFMSLLILGLFLTMGKDPAAIIAFALAGGLLGFLYYNFNPARIFMGDTGSLVLGFVTAVLCIRMIQLQSVNQLRTVVHAPVFALCIVAIPVFDTIRVFAIRIWQGRSPFSPDKNHIHHLLTNNGFSHSFTSKIICIYHAVVLITGYLLKDIPQLFCLAILLIMMLIMVILFRNLKPGMGNRTMVSIDRP